MKNVTITLEDEVAQWARVHAAKQKTSVSRWLGQMLRERMLAAETYQASMEQFLSIRPRRLRDDKTKPYPPREELHDRAGLR